MGTNAMTIDRWRTAHPQEAITGSTLCRILGLRTLRNADLAGAELQGADLAAANLAGANLEGADLRYAYLGGADLRDANLRGAFLRGANLQGVSLRGANLRGADGGILQVTGLHPYPAYMVPTAGGWELSIGCWTGSIDALRVMIAGDEWPEAAPHEQIKRRPILAALADLCDAHATYHAHALACVKEKWAGADQ